MILQYKIADKSDIEDLLAARCETLRAVCHLESDFKFSEKFLNDARNYFEQGHHTTVLALDQDKIIGCASICYITVMPTFDHPTGKRAHIMNVYTKKEYRRQSIGTKMISMLLEDAQKHGATEISLDATPEGKLLYKKCGFKMSTENMVYRKSAD